MATTYQIQTSPAPAKYEVVTGNGAVTYEVITGGRGPAGLDGAKTWNELTGTLEILPFDTSNGGPVNLGEVGWTSEDGCLTVALEHDVMLQIGEETLYRVENETGTTIADGSPVMYAGTVGNSGRMRVKVWDGTDTQAFMGFATSDIETGLDGYVTHFGKVRGIQTNGANYSQTWPDGSIIYAVQGSANLTNVKPSTGGYVAAAVVISAHASNGTLFVRPTRVPTITDIGAAATSHTHSASEISDSTTVGRSLMTAASASAARTTLELGNAALTTTSTGGNGAADSGKVLVFKSNGAASCSAEFYIAKNTTTGARYSVAGLTDFREHYAPDASGVFAITSNSSGQIQWSELGGVPLTFTPSAHKSTHAVGGTDALSPADIGAAATSHTHTASQISDSTATGRSLVTTASASAARTTLELGNAALTTTSTGGNGAADSGKVAVYGSTGELMTSGAFAVKVNGFVSAFVFGAMANSYAWTSPEASGTLALTTNTSGIPDNLVTSATKTTPVDADSVLMTDSEAAGTPAKRITFANLWTWILTKLGGSLTIAGDKILTGVVSFTNAARPKSSGTGTPAADDLVTLADVDARVGVVVTAVLSSNSSNVSSKTTPKDSGLSLSIPSAGVWEVYFCAAIESANAAAGSRSRLVSSATSFFKLNTLTTFANAGAMRSGRVFAYTTETGAGQCAAIGVTLANHSYYGIIETTEAITLKFQFAQWVSDAGNTWVQSGARGFARKIPT